MFKYTREGTEYYNKHLSEGLVINKTDLPIMTERFGKVKGEALYSVKAKNRTQK